MSTATPQLIPSTASTASSRFPEMPQRFGESELAYLKEAIESNNLFHTRAGGFVTRATSKLCQVTGAAHSAACSSGTASIHVALGALGIEAGTEVITSPITDMGSLIGILYQNAIPVFADVDPHTYNLTPDSIAAAITPRTSAVMVVHLAGGPCKIDAIAELCRSRKIALIEDCAQAWGTTYHGQHVGTFGDIGCFSFNHFKHLSCGDGGMITTNDARLAERCRNFADKFYDRAGRGVRMHELAPNYRMSELQAAVSLAQLEKLDSIAGPRHLLGDLLTDYMRAARLPGITPHGILPDAYGSYWFYMLRIDEKAAGIGRDELVAAFNAIGANARGGYLPRPIYKERVFQKKQFFPGGIWPAEAVAGRTYDYTAACCPVAEDVLSTAIVLPIHEGMQPDHMLRYMGVLKQALTRQGEMSPRGLLE